MHVPHVNPFTPTNLEMLKYEDHASSGDGDDPVLVVDDDFVRMLCAAALSLCALLLSHPCLPLGCRR
jgi:hypothetical protein